MAVGPQRKHHSATEFMIDVVFEVEEDIETKSESKEEESTKYPLLRALHANVAPTTGDVEVEDRALVDYPFYVVDLGLVARKFVQWNRLFPRVKPFYAVKCNPDPGVVKTLAFMGAGFDCASKAEISQVLDQGWPSNFVVDFV